MPMVVAAFIDSVPLVSTICFFTSLGYFGLNEAARELETPFGLGANHLCAACPCPHPASRVHPSSGEHPTNRVGCGSLSFCYSPYPDVFGLLRALSVCCSACSWSLTSQAVGGISRRLQRKARTFA